VRGGLEAFPIGAAGIVDVHVRIDEAGKNGGVAKIVELGVGGNLIGRDYVEQAFSFDKKSGGADRVWRYNSAGEKGAQNHSKTGAREQIQELVRIRLERRRIASPFQVSKIDNSRRKKCWAAGLAGIYLPIGEDNLEALCGIVGWLGKLRHGN
jgi:hypothetical protein